MKIQFLIDENKNWTDDDTTGIFTTGILSRIRDGHQIARFCTGRNHAGENIAELYGKRDAGLPPPIQMCDALSRKTADKFKAIVCNSMS